MDPSANTPHFFACVSILAYLLMPVTVRLLQKVAEN